MLKEVKLKAQNIAEHQRKYERKHEEREIKERMERVKKAQEKHERAQKEEEARQHSGTQYSSFPGGFPGGTPGLNEILSDPEFLAAMQNSEVMMAFQDVAQNLAKCQNIRASQRLLI